MKAFLCLALLLAASAAQAQSYTAAVNRATNGVTVAGGYTTMTQISHSSSGATYTTTVTRSGGHQPMGNGGYNPMGH
jgi:hypothetical protein